MPSSLWKAIIVIPFLWYAANACSEVVILTPQSKSATDIATRIKKKIYNQDVIVTTTPTASNHPTLVITLGKDVLKENINKIQAPLLATFLPPSDYLILKGASITENNHTLYSVASPEFLLSFIKSTLGAVRLGYVFSSKEDPYLFELREMSERYKLEIIGIELKEDNIFKTYRELFKHQSVDIMLITKNAKAYPPKKLRYILEALYREKIPAIGLSKSLIGTGVIASIYASEDEFVDQIALTANAILKKSTIEQQIYANRNKVSIDYDFARKLGIHVKKFSHE